MSIYRGPGGSGDAVNDASSQAAITVIARDEAVAAKNAAQLAQAAAELAETNAETAEAGANTAKNAAQTAATNASSFASAASTSASNASTSATNAATSATNAATSETNAAAYELSANNWATKTSGPVAGGEYSSKYNAQLSATSASAASGSATAAASSASAASTSATNAANSASSASTSATNAASSATSASGSATSASSSASSASTSATNAASSATSAAGSATTATTQAGLASTSATNAANSASSAYTSATNAASSASNASTSATAAASAQTAAESARDATLAAYDSFDDRYLGVKSADPTVDNDGNALVAGALYFNSVAGSMKVYTGSAWTAAYVSGAGVLLIANNLSDLSSVSTARTNLGLGTAATTNSTAYATAAQGTKADSALQPANIGSTVQGWDGDLDAIAALTGTSGLLKKTAANTWSLDTTSYATGGGSATGTNTGDETATTIRTKIGAASSTNSGYLTSTDWSTFNNKQPAGTYATGTGTASGTNTGDETTATIQSKLGTASTSTSGYLTSTDWNTFNNKQAALVSGTNIKTVGGVSVLGSGDVSFNNISPITAAGDLIIGNGANSATRLPIGTNGYLLTSNGTTASWQAAPVSLPSQTGNSGKYLTTDGTNASWGTPTGGQFFGTATTKAIAYNSSTIAENITVSENSMSVGPITINSGYTVTVSAGKRWVIL